MRHDIKHLDKSAQAHNLLAANLMKYSFQNEYTAQAPSMHNEAAFHFRRAIEIYPDFFNAWYDLGRTYMILNNMDSAFVCFIKVHEMDSTLSDATLNIAIIAETKQDYNTAIKYYERIIKFNPYVLEAYNNLSYLYFRLQQPEKSIEVNKRAIAYNTNWREPYENIKRVEDFIKQHNISIE
jgi:tetratricopeptide (TPR) repeat protein